jgi:hypothetical protein
LDIPPPVNEDTDTDDSDWGEDKSEGTASEKSGEELVYEGEVEAEGDHMAQQYQDMPKDFSSIIPFVSLCGRQWRSAWRPGTILVPDESMVQWVGGGAPHLTLIPRKPTPLGLMFKTVCCAETGILLNAELQECAEDMHKKEFFTKWGATTACTLRLV